MPHQCLNCGLVIPRGSQDILTGCSQCGGKKFMYVSKPLSEDRRLQIKNKADEVREQLLAKADPHLLEILEKKGVGSIDGARLTIEGGKGEGWVRVTPEPEPEPRVPEVTAEREAPRKKSAKEIIERYDREIAESGRYTRPDAVKGVLEELGPVKKKAKKKGVKAPEGKAEIKKARKPKSRPEGGPTSFKPDDIDVVKIVETGVYEINVQRLLEDSPIIIERDGTYLIHLPSLLESGRYRKK